MNEIWNEIWIWIEPIKSVNIQCINTRPWQPIRSAQSVSPNSPINCTVDGRRREGRAIKKSMTITQLYYRAAYLHHSSLPYFVCIYILSVLLLQPRLPFTAARLTENWFGRGWLDLQISRKFCVHKEFPLQTFPDLFHNYFFYFGAWSIFHCLSV
jgi:hypothetical protein